MKVCHVSARFFEPLAALVSATDDNLHPIPAVKSSLPAQVSRLKNLPIAMDESYGFNALVIRMCESIIWDPLSCPQCVFIYLDLSISIEKTSI